MRNLTWFLTILTMAATIIPVQAQKGTVPTKRRAPPIFRVIQGNPLRIHVGDDTSFQVFNAALPGNGQLFPSESVETADMGALVRLNGELYAPNFAEHPGSAAGGLGNFAPWTPFSLSQVSGSGTPNNPFRVTCTVLAGSSGLTMEMVVTYVNGDTFFRTDLNFTASSARQFHAYFAGDIYLAASDSGIPIVFNNGIGGQDCQDDGYSIVFFPITPSSAFSGSDFNSIWTQIGQGGLNNDLASTCLDNGAALEWRNVNVSSNGVTSIAIATSFGLNVSEVPQVSLEVFDNDASETGPDNAEFRITRNLSSGAIRVSYDLTGTAVNGEDYAILSGTQTIPDGAFTSRIVISPLADGLVEGDETVIMTLRTDPAYTLGEVHSGTVVIHDGSACAPPTEVLITDIETDSFLTTVVFGANGGICRLFEGDEEIGGILVEDAGEFTITTEGTDITPDTEYTVCCTNICEGADGFFESEAVCTTITTRSLAPPPVLKPPVFVKESNFYPTENGNLGCFFPDPNGDGADSGGSGNLGYIVTLEDLNDCTIFIGPVVVSSDTWPQVLEVNASDIPISNYFIKVRRTVVGANKRRMDSNPVVISGPDLTVLEPPTIARDFTRWLLHMPRKSGGFDGVVEVNNPNNAETVSVLFVGYDNTGQLLFSEAKMIGPSETKLYRVYEAGEGGIFGSAGLEDQISHVSIWERTNLTEVKLQIISRTSSFRVKVDEADFTTGQVNGFEFLMDGSTPTPDYFAGVAVTNLSSEQASEIVVIRTNPANQQTMEISLGTLMPGHKMLSVVSTAFNNFVPDAVYTIESRGPAVVQVLGLHGLINGEFLDEAPVNRKR